MQGVITSTVLILQSTILGFTGISVYTYIYIYIYLYLYLYFFIAYYVVCYMVDYIIDYRVYYSRDSRESCPQFGGLGCNTGATILRSMVWECLTQESHESRSLKEEYQKPPRPSKTLS